MLVSLALVAASNVTVSTDLIALGALVAAGVSAASSARLLRANRRKILDEASNAATEAADRILARFESDNARLREEVDELERELVQARRELAGTRATIDELEATLTATEATIAALRSELDRRAA